MADEMTLPQAQTRPGGSVVIGTTPDQRSDLRNGLVVLALGLTVVGLGAGYLMGSSKGRKANPTHPLIALRPSGILRQIFDR